MIQLSERTLGDWLEHWAKETPAEFNLQMQQNSD